MPNETRATRYHRARLQAGAGAFLVSLLVLVAFGNLGARPDAGRRCCTGSDRGWLAPGRLGGHRGCSRPSSSSSAHAARYPFDRHREWTLEGRYGLARLSAGRWLACPPARHRRADHGRHRGGAARGRDLALVRQRLVARHRRRLLPGPSGLDGGGAAAARPPSAGCGRCAGRRWRPGSTRWSGDRGVDSPCANGAAATRRCRRTRRSPASAGPARSCSRTRSSTRCATRRSRSSSRTRSGTTSTATSGGRRRGGSSRCR